MKDNYITFTHFLILDCEVWKTEPSLITEKSTCVCLSTSSLCIYEKKIKLNSQEIHALLTTVKSAYHKTSGI